jgi:ribosomal protein S8
MYILINPNAPKMHQEITKIEAGCYTDALIKALERLGYILEATEKEEKEIINSHTNVALKEWEQVTNVGQIEAFKEKLTESHVQPKVCPFTHKNLEIFKMISQKPCTIAEVVEKCKVAPATATTAIRSLFRRNGYFVKEETQPGIDGIIYSIP